MDQRRYHMGVISNEVREWIRSQEMRFIPPEEEIPIVNFNEPVDTGELKRSWGIPVILAMLILGFTMFLGGVIYYLISTREGGGHSLYPFYQQLNKWSEARIIKVKPGAIKIENRKKISQPVIIQGDTRKPANTKVSPVPSSRENDAIPEAPGVMIQ